jgi:hypothetical protein
LVLSIIAVSLALTASGWFGLGWSDDLLRFPMCQFVKPLVGKRPRNPPYLKEPFSAMVSARYLRHVFTELPKAKTQAEIEALLLWYIVLATHRVAA